MSDAPHGEASSTTTTRIRRFWAAGALVLLLASVLRFWALDLGLPHRLARPDEIDVLRMTTLPSQGQFDLGWSVYPSAYVYLSWIWVEAGLQVERALGAETAGYLETFRRAPDRMFVLARSLSAVAGVLAVGLLMVLGRRTLGDGPALGAGLLLATSFLHARDSHAAKPDALLALGIVVGLLAMVPLVRRATPAAGARAGVGVGAAMALKYPAVFLVIPLYLTAVRQSVARGWRRLVPLPAVVGGAVAAAVFLATSPFLLLSEASLQGLENTVVLAFPFLSPEQTAEATTTFGLSIDPAPPSEYSSPAWWGGLRYHTRFSLWYGAGAWATLLALPALAWGVVCRRPMAAAMVAFIVPYVLVVGLSPPALLARYMTPVLPPLLLLEAGMLHAAARRFVPRFAPLAFGLAVCVVAAGPLTSAVSHNRIASETDTRVLATRWLREHVPAGSRVAVVGTRFYHWGAPVIPRSLEHVEVPSEGGDPLEGVEYLVTHDHPLFYSTVDPELLERLRPRLALEAEFAAFDPERAEPLFEAADAYYIPVHAFSGVERPGPEVRIYRVE